MASSAPVQRTPVIIDTDPGVDDIIAILFALASPELEILAYVVSFGNTDVDSSYTNVLKAYQAVARHLESFPEDRDRFPNFATTSKPILARGCRGPLEGDLHSAQYFHGRDGLGGIAERHPELDVSPTPGAHPQLEISEQAGVDVALELLRSHPPRSVTYLAMGPLTTLAKMLQADGDLVRNRIGRIVCMGGALDVPGNTSPVAEFNFFADPYAVKELLLPSEPGKGIPLDRFVLLPLDITTPHELPFPVYKERVDRSFESPSTPSVAAEKSPLLHFTSSFLEQTRTVMLQFGKDAMELHDIAAVWCAIENPPSLSDPSGLMAGWRSSLRRFDIERTGELTRGMLIVDRREDENAYAPGANRAKVQAELDKLEFEHVGEWESTAVPAQVEVELEGVPDVAPSAHAGVRCVTRTPGPDVLLDLLIRRVWGA